MWVIMNRACFLLDFELLGTIRSLSLCGPLVPLATQFLAHGCTPDVVVELNVTNNDAVHTSRPRVVYLHSPGLLSTLWPNPRLGQRPGRAGLGWFPDGQR